MTPRGRILIVDDEANARTALAELVRDEGYAVETAADGFKALPKLEELAPDLLLTDLRMPGMDGLELMRKALERDANLAVVVMTAYGAVETGVAAMKLGAADYLTKPINLDELAVVLERALERRRQRAARGGAAGPATPAGPAGPAGPAAGPAGAAGHAGDTDGDAASA